MIAVVETGGKQYRVQKDDVITVEKLDVEAGKKVTLDKVLLVIDDSKVAVGTPYVKDAKVNTTVVENGKGEKVIVFKYKAKKDERKKQGHRQPYTMLKVNSISFGGKEDKEEKAAAPKKEAAPKAAKAAAPKKEAAPKAEKPAAEKKAATAKAAAPKTEKKPAAPKKAAAPKKEAVPKAEKPAAEKKPAAKKPAAKKPAADK